MPAVLLSDWEYTNLTDRVFLRHDLLQRLLNYSTLHIVLEVRLATGQLDPLLSSGSLTRKSQSSRARRLHPFAQAGRACRG